MNEEFMLRRSERRSFFCPNKLWIELKKQTNECYSISTYIRQAILEKMIKDEPKKKEYFEELLL